MSTINNPRRESNALYLIVRFSSFLVEQKSRRLVFWQDAMPHRAFQFLLAHEHIGSARDLVRQSRPFAPRPRRVRYFLPNSMRTDARQACACVAVSVTRRSCPCTLRLEDRHAMQQCHRGAQMSKGRREQYKRRRRKGKGSMHFEHFLFLGLQILNPPNLERWILMRCTPAPARLPSPDPTAKVAAPYSQVYTIWIFTMPSGSSNEMVFVMCLADALHRFRGKASNFFFKVDDQKVFTSLKLELTNSQEYESDSFALGWKLPVFIIKLCTILLKHLPIFLWKTTLRIILHLHFLTFLNNPIVHFDLRCIGWCRRGKNVKWFDKCGCFACLLGQETWPAQTEFFCQPRRSHALFLPFWPAAVYMWLQALHLCVSELWRPTFFFTSLAPTTDQEHLPYFFHYPLGIAGHTRVY